MEPEGSCPHFCPVCDPYVVLRLGDQMEVTHTKAMTTEPVWNEDFRLRVFRNLELEVAVMSRGVGEQELGSATVPALELLSGDAPPPSLVEDLSVETAPRPAARWGQTQIHFLSCSGTALFLTLCNKKGGHSTCLAAAVFDRGAGQCRVIWKTTQQHTLCTHMMHIAWCISSPIIWEAFPCHHREA